MKECYLSQYMYMYHGVSLPVLGTEKIQTITPFHATYWKTLPFAYEISYVKAASLGWAGEDYNPDQLFLTNSYTKEIASWVEKTKCWYTNYFDS